MSQILRLTEKDIPDNTLIAVLSDIHIPIHDRAACSIAMECADNEGADTVIFNGDIADSGVVSRHEDKRQRDVIDWGTLKKACAKGRDIIDWGRSKRKCYKIRGNHAAWVEKKIQMDAALRDTVTPEQLMGWPEDGDRWTVLPSLSKIKIGSLNIEHGDGFFKKGNGGTYPAARILARAPNQTTLIGHLHRVDFKCMTVQNELGHDTIREAHVSGHLSIAAEHAEYMGTYPGWQQSFTFIRVNWRQGRPKYTITPVLIYRDHKNRPTFTYNGKVYCG